MISAKKPGRAGFGHFCLRQGVLTRVEEIAPEANANSIVILRQSPDKGIGCGGAI